MAEVNKKLVLWEAQRAQYYSRVQSIFNMVSKIDTNETIKKQFLSKAHVIDELRNEYKQIVDKINLLQLTEKPEFVISYATLDSFEDLYCEIKLAMDRCRGNLSESHEQSVSMQSSINNSIKIPRIDLPMFDGEIQNFPFFYETFKRMIHNNLSLSDSERVHYLFSHLTGKAKSMCAGIVPSAENYGPVWEALKTKYYDKRALGTSYLNQILAMKPITSPSAQALENLIDKFATTISALKQLQIDNLSEFIFVNLGLKLLDSETARQFEMSIRCDKGMPNYEEFVKFVREQVKILHRTSQPQSSARRDSSYSNNNNNTKPRPRASHAHITTHPASTSNVNCPLCDSNSHSQISVCDKFLKMSSSDRYKCVKKNNWCTNCLGSQHWASKCLSEHSCRKCHKRHHTLLHIDSWPSSSSGAMKEVSKPTTSGSGNSTKNLKRQSDDLVDNQVSLCTMSSLNESVTDHNMTEILGTAIVLAVSRTGRDVRLRCLLDPGSQKHYITTRCVRMLGLHINRDQLASVRGIGGATQPVRGSVDLSFRSRVQGEKLYCIKALVLDNITSKLPTSTVDMSRISGFERIPLADESWGRPAEVDLLIGVELFADVLLPGKIMNPPGLPNAIETVLGFVVLGNAPVKNLTSTSSVSFCATYEVENLIKKFWEVEDFGNAPPLSLAEKQAEEIYNTTVKRDKEGRYEVALPFKVSPNNLGNSFNTAMRRLLCLERKFKYNASLKSMYDAAIQEHLDKGYLSEIMRTPQEGAYYIPHHAVVREDKTTTKLRVVLDASSATDTGLSLNDVLHAGPNLQTDLLSILLNLRLFPIAITGDVRQMYMAIKVQESDKCYQRILYRFNSNEPIRVFQYNRVAFGLRCSPFLALRTVQQLVTDEGDKFPAAREVASRDIYMDDIASSIVDETRAIETVHELVAMFMAGGFQLAKWSSNSLRVLDEIPEELRLSESVSFDDDTTFKILGLRWYPGEDQFSFQVTTDERRCTKRHMLSCIARLFDVLGLVAPVILFAKLLIKDLWIAKVAWDAVPPKSIIQKWDQFQRELPLISQLKFPRHIGVVKNCSLTILGFADASEKAYGGVVYAYVSTPDNHFSINLVCAKSKVAPLKVVSLARLELCAALLLAQLIDKVVKTYSSRYHIQSIFAFSDSNVALSWIHSEPYRWQTFVANRVAKIHEYLGSDHFYHIKGTENPSDCLSRGLTPAQLLTHPLWLKGPPWISEARESWPIKPFVVSQESLPEAKSVTLLAVNAAHENVIYQMARNFSSWTKYVRSVAYVLKFIKKLPKGPITATDLNISELMIFKVLQQVHFSQNISDLKAGRSVSDILKQLKPFMDDGIIRVGGRLENSNEIYEYKHQILLPRQDHIIEILIDHYHRKNCHAGPEMLMSILRQRYWVISARRIIRQRIQKCNYCFRNKPRATIYPIMADLPASRVNLVEKPFTHTGCDYAGPLPYVPQRRRGVKSQKAYICIFTCLTTRAVHIELATDLSTASFLSAFKRFLSRRGPIKVVHSDNGTNFVGAKSYLRDLHNFLSKEYRQYWEKELADNRITWKMICPSAPHHGGSWESIVKSVKTHLFRTVGAQILSYEELLTVLTQVEALLNSRPLCTLSSDPSEPTALTPAHFLNVRPLNYLPASDTGNTLDHLLKRHELLDKIVGSFWKRWQNEYLHTLQARRKWNTPSQPIQEGTVVVLMQENVMPLHWPLGVIVQLLPGKDGTVRIVNVKTKTGIYQRPVVKLCPLPTQ